MDTSEWYMLAILLNYLYALFLKLIEKKLWLEFGKCKDNRKCCFLELIFIFFWGFLLSNPSEN